MFQGNTSLSSEVFEGIFDNLPVAISVKKLPNFDIVYVNSTFETLAHKNADEILGRQITDIFSPDAARQMEELDAKIVAEKVPLKISLKNPFGNNPNLMLEVQKIPLLDKSKSEVQYIVDYYQNISQQASADAILRETELLYKKIFENLPLGIALIRAEDYTIIEVNSNFLNIFELEFDKVMYKPVYELPFCTEKERLAIYFNTSKEFDSAQTLERKYTLPSGKVVNVLFSIFYLKFLEQEPWFVLVVNDISTLEEANQEILAHIKKEQELNRLKNRFISLISHELRTPLSAISLSVDILQKFGEKIDDKEKERNFEQIRSSIKTISNLLENVARLEKLTDTDFTLNFQQISFKEAVKKISKEVEQAFNLHNAINLQFHEEDDFLCETDEVLLEIVLTNLINNAVKFSPEGKGVNIKVRNINGSIECSIQNFGEPIPTNEINHIFAPFYRGSNIGKSKGFGVGLSLVKKALELLNGSIEISSSANEGTIVKFTLPIRIKSR